MKYRRFGRTDWQVSEMGYGMWGLAGWTGTDKKEVRLALQRAVELGCNFFDTAWAYGNGISEEILGDLLRENKDKQLYAASKIPPKNRVWPSQSQSSINDVFPADYIIEYTEKSLRNLKVETLDLQQFHVWEDAWSANDEWKEAVTRLKQQGKVRAIGISVNRWEPTNVLATLCTGLIDAVQVIYNIFDQAPEDALFPLCSELDIALIARVPFDEGTLTGTFTHNTTFPDNDWRSTYFVPDNLAASVKRADALRPLIPNGMTMPELALRFILANQAVSTVIPGMRQLRHVEQNMRTSDGETLSADLLKALQQHRWDREPTVWSQ